ncbi:MAG TPA: hypothetical protein VFR25_04060 [Candidatus Eisenbacteria bacterium]|nr:hypothetical protein [Candidatus Eisenbacteria bacterium]
MDRIQCRWRVSALAVLLPIAALAALGRPMQARATPPGYFVDQAEAEGYGDRPFRLDETAYAFSVSVDRAASDTLSARLLAIAESTYPERDPLVVNALDHRWEMGADTAHAVVWWSRGVGPNRIPQAATWRAVRYYADLCAHYRRNLYLNTGTRAPMKSELTYWATIDHKDRFGLEGSQFNDVYVANMNLFWGIDDGAFDMITTAHRTVVIDPSGEVLQVVGDAPGDESVMISGWRDRWRESANSARRPH